MNGEALAETEKGGPKNAPHHREGSAATRVAGAGGGPKALCLVPRAYRDLEDAAVTPAAGQVGQVKSQSAVCQATVCAHRRQSGVGGVRREGRSGKTAEDGERIWGRGCNRKTKARAFQVVMSPVDSGQDVEVPKAPARSWFVVCSTPYPYHECLEHNQ